MRRLIGPIAPRRRGAVLILVALLLIFLVILLAFAVDVGLICLADSHLQNAADAAALAGALELRCDCTGRADKARAAAIDFARRNTAAGEPVELQPGDVRLGTWANGAFTALSGANEQAANSVQVTCVRARGRGNPLRLVFAAAFGDSSVDLAASATAKVESSRCAQIVGINSVSMSGGSRTDSYDSSLAAYKKNSAAGHGHVCSNGDIALSGGARILGDARPGPGRLVQRAGGSRVTGSSAPRSAPLSYPPVDPGNAARVNDNARIPKTRRKLTVPDAQGRLQLDKNDSVDLPPGVYYFTSLTLSGGASIGITGKTVIYVSGNIDLSAGTMTNTTQRAKNLQLYPMGAECDLSGGADLYAVVYGPKTAIRKSGGADLYGSVVGATLTLSGGHGIHADESLDSELLQAGVRAVLVD